MPCSLPNTTTQNLLDAPPHVQPNENLGLSCPWATKPIKFKTACSTSTHLHLSSPPAQISQALDNEHIPAIHEGNKMLDAAYDLIGPLDLTKGFEPDTVESPPYNRDPTNIPGLGIGHGKRPAM